MNVQTIYEFGEHGRTPLQTVEIPDERAPAGHILLTADASGYTIDAQDVDLSHIELLGQGYNGRIVAANGVVVSITLQSSTTIERARLSIEPFTPALKEYGRFRDKKGREWQLMEGVFPKHARNLQDVRGKIVTESRIKGFGSAMAGLAPHICFLEAERKWKLLPQAKYLPKKE